MRKFALPGLLSSFLIIVTSLFALYTYLDYSRSIADARTTSAKVLTQSSRTVHAELRRISDAVRQLFDIIDRCNQDGALDFLSPRSVNRITTPFLKNDSSLTSLNYGNGSGDGYLILQTDTAFRNRIRRNVRPGWVTWIDLDEFGTERARAEVADDYDPRIRPWYRAAGVDARIVWGEPYIFRTTRDLGITASRTLSSRGGAPGEVVGIDIKLKDLSRFLGKISLHEQSAIEVVDGQGYVLASSRFAQFEKYLAGRAARPPRLTDPEFILQHAVMDFYRSSQLDQFEITQGGTGYFVKIAPFPLDNGTTILTILTLPREAFMSGFLSTFHRNLVLFLLFLGVITVYFLARYIVPVRRLTRYSRNFSLDNIPPPLPVRRHDEIGILTASINGMIDTIRDRTAALRLSEEHYRTLVQSARSIILRWDSSGTITFINDHGAEFFGYRAEELIGRKVVGTIVASTDSVGNDLIRMIESICATPEAFRSNQNENVTRDGRTVWVNWSNVAVCDLAGNAVEILSVGNDATFQVEAERQIRSLNEELEQRVRERTNAFEVSNRELEAFCYSVSHDLRAPLRHIDGYSHMLIEDHAAALNREATEILERISRSTRRMGTLIDDLLELSRITRQELRPSPVNLSALAREIVEELQRSDPDRKPDVTIAGNVVVQGDATLLRVVLVNLLGNAWKYTSLTAAPAIVFGANSSPDGLVFFVQDNGVGFDMQFCDKLFQPFQRLHRSDEFEGTGIGLAIVQRIILRHDGTVWATATPGKGATFFCRIPKTDCLSPDSGRQGGVFDL